jgi:hypothetical protein
VLRKIALCPAHGDFHLSKKLYNRDMLFNRFSDYYKRFEKYISAVGLIYGFIFTSLTLTRVDTFWENFWIVFHLILATIGILTLTFFENRAAARGTEYPSLHFYLILVIQFAFGGLFSTFFVFYMRSASISDSWFFLFVLLILLVGNEIWKKHYARLAFQATVLFVAVYLFLIFLLPVIFGRLGADLFVVSGILSLLFTVFFVSLLKRFSYEKFRNDHNVLAASVMTVFIFLNILYFNDLIPPIPLSIKQSGVLHAVSRNADGNYDIKTETKSFFDYFDRYPDFNKRSGERVYVFSAVFSPVKFATEIIHEWQYYDAGVGEWQTTSKVSLPIIGGRDGGYRTYSYQSILLDGLWRVKVKTVTGQTIGQIKFEIVNSNESINLVSEVW